MRDARFQLQSNMHIAYIDKMHYYLINPPPVKLVSMELGAKPPKGGFFIGGKEL